ncbi:MAG: hypothetical protein KME17_31745 [Cyanosarcina radialis HA8281-LM2]|nr:hypothetical protein [Cyanosarcina radialis HA8281-LM2]
MTASIGAAHVKPIASRSINSSTRCYRFYGCSIDFFSGVGILPAPQ